MYNIHCEVTTAIKVIITSVIHHHLFLVKMLKTYSQQMSDLQCSIISLITALYIGSLNVLTLELQFCRL